MSWEQFPYFAFGTLFLWGTGVFWALRNASVWKVCTAMLAGGVLLAVFIGINLLRPEIQSKALPPVLQSPWFVPHVLVYMLAYALLGVAVLVAVYLLWIKKGEITSREMKVCDGLLSAGFSFLTAGMLFGALWAQAAWGHYWSWDPKESWAAATWLAFLACMHFRKHRPLSRRFALYMLLFSFLLLQMCWYGVNYLPSLKGNSLHIYS
jgi:ABC-type transport system involved in cytochrome c biogenesis permease subunit